MKSACKWCSDEGVIMAHHKFRNAGEYAFRCQCPAQDKRDYEGRRLVDSRIKQWTDAHHDKYIPEYARDEPRHANFMKNQETKKNKEIRELGLKKDWNHPKLKDYVKRQGKDALLSLLNGRGEDE